MRRKDKWLKIAERKSVYNEKDIGLIVMSPLEYAKVLRRVDGAAEKRGYQRGRYEHMQKETVRP